MLELSNQLSLSLPHTLPLSLIHPSLLIALCLCPLPLPLLSNLIALTPASPKSQLTTVHLCIPFFSDSHRLSCLFLTSVYKGDKTKRLSLSRISEVICSISTEVMGMVN